MQVPGLLLLATLSLSPALQTPARPAAGLEPLSATPRPALGVTNMGVTLRFFNPYVRSDPGALVGERFVALNVDEDAQGADLNGNGYPYEVVLHVYDQKSGSLVNTQLAVDTYLLSTFESDGTVATLVLENGVDLNGDGDGTDRVLHLVDAATGAATNLRLSVTGYFDTGTEDRLRERAGTFACELSEDGDQDLNGDGDKTDVVLGLGLLGPRSRLRPRTPGLARLSATPLLATGDLPSQDATLMALDDDFLLFGVDELYQGGTDLNGDGDAVDFSVLHLVETRTGALRNLGISGNFIGLGEGFLAFRSPEASEGRDLNGDGDLLDEVLHCYDTATGVLTDLGLAVDAVLTSGPLVAGLVSEAGQGVDLNGDGDTLDSVPFVYEHAAGVTTMLPLAALEVHPAGGGMLVLVSEARQGEDLNGDGDLLDDVLHRYWVATGTTTNEGLVVSPGTLDRGARFVALRISEPLNALDFNGDGDLLDNVHFVYDGALDTLVNTGFNGRSVQVHRESGPYMALGASESGVDLNGDGDGTDTVALVYDGTNGSLINTGLAVLGLNPLGDVGLRGNKLLVPVSEVNQGSTDLNGDGDAYDSRVAFLVTLP